MPATHLPIADVMTAMPVTIGADQALARARDLMDEYRIRHLPVLELGRLAGIVSERELDLLLTAPEIDAERVPISRAMSRNILIVAPEESVAAVATKMLEHRAGSAVVARRGDVVGVFTTTDALALLSQRR